MNRSLTIIIMLVSFITFSGNAMANGKGVNPFFGPGNSAAGKGSPFPNSQPNCVGDIVSTLARQGGLGTPGKPDPSEDTLPQIISGVFDLGAIIGVIFPFDTCGDLVAP